MAVPAPSVDQGGSRVRDQRTLLLALLVLVVWVGASCGSTSASTSMTGTITVSAAASLTEPFEHIGDDFEKANPGVEVTFNFGSSGALSKQILDGAAADGFASADEANMEKLTDASLVAGPPTVFARNRLTIVVKKGNPKQVATLADLATVGTVSLCGTDVPCGVYADQILTRANVAIPAGTVTRGQNVKATLAAVAEGDADAGIVYATDVRGDKVQAVSIPDAQNAVATYPIAVVAASSHKVTMQAFIAYVMSAPGRATLEAAGFLPPS